MEKTLVLIKPDAFKGHHTGDIIKLYEEKGLHLLAMRLMKMTKEVAAKHYEEHIGRPYYKELETFMLSGPIVARVLAGDDAIQKVRDLNGKTDPKEAAPGTIRQLYAASKGENAVHASDSPASAAREIHIFFNETEIFD
ncbi:MAG: nucleoside-diphosphate kinase [Negativicutes bacterium]